MPEFEVKDSGARQEYESGMRRDTQDGKPDYTLIDRMFLKRLAMHMTKGAKKYSQPTVLDLDTNSMLYFLLEELEKCNPTVKITQIDLYTLEDYVNPVMIGSSGRKILPMPNASGRIAWTGRKNLLVRSGLKHIIIGGIMTPYSEPNVNVPTRNIDLDLWDLLQSRHIVYLNGKITSVPSVRNLCKNIHSILTMSTLIKNQNALDWQEVTYAMVVTEDWDSWEILSRVLRELYPTSKILQLNELSENKFRILLKNTRNWQLANSQEELERFQSSAFRHMMQWLDGDIDEDHMAACAFNLAAAEHVKEKLYATQTE